MKALCIKQPWAAMIACGMKTIETRTWRTVYRGDFLIVSSASPKINGILSGCAIGIARLTDCAPMTKEDEQASCCALYSNAWAWTLRNVRLIRPFPVKGHLQFFNVDIPEGYEEYGLFDQALAMYYLDCLKLHMGKGGLNGKQKKEDH